MWHLLTLSRIPWDAHEQQPTLKETQANKYLDIYKFVWKRKSNTCTVFPHPRLRLRVNHTLSCRGGSRFISHFFALLPETMNSPVGNCLICSLLFKTKEILQLLLAPLWVFLALSGFCLHLTCVSLLCRNPGCAWVGYWEWEHSPVERLFCGPVCALALDPVH